MRKRLDPLQPRPCVWSEKCSPTGLLMHLTTGNYEKGDESSIGIRSKGDRKNLFSFQFLSISDMRDILDREP
ncbi:hypothetical protein ACS0TY_014581 [Phlomoides rotata]